MRRVHRIKIPQPLLKGDKEGEEMGEYGVC